MLSLNQIEKFYTDKEKPFKKNILREYLQYKILEIIFNQSFSNKLSFMGGTCLRIVYGTSKNYKLKLCIEERINFRNFLLIQSYIILCGSIS